MLYTYHIIYTCDIWSTHFWTSDGFKTDTDGLGTDPHHDVRVINIQALVCSGEKHHLITKGITNLLEQVWIGPGGMTRVGLFVFVIKNDGASAF